MNETLQFKEKLDSVFTILLELERMKQSIIQISNTKSKFHESTISKSQFFNLANMIFTKMFVIDLIKLINKSKNNHFNFFDVIDFCKDNLNKIEFTHSISMDSLLDLEKLLVIPDEIFNAIKLLRDKHYAHIDGDRFDYEINLKQEDLWKILENYQKIFTFLCSNFNNNYWIFELQFSGVPELHKCGQYDLLRKIILDSRKNKENQIQTEKLYEILSSYR